MTKRFASIAVVIAVLPLAMAQGAMPVEQQNALVQKHCAVCHSDAAMNGGFSLQHFDAAHVEPALAAMVFNKIANVSIETGRLAQSDPGAAQQMRAGIGSGAMGAAGVTLPDKPTQDAWVAALVEEAKGAENWTVTKGPSAVTASIVREVHSAKAAGEANLYWLTVTCRPAAHEIEMQLAWGPGTPKKGAVMTAAIDGKAPVSYKLDRMETYGNGMKGSSVQGSVMLLATGEGASGHSLELGLEGGLPRGSLAVTRVFGEERVEFPFGELSGAARQELSACFGTHRNRQ